MSWHLDSDRAANNVMIMSGARAEEVLNANRWTMLVQDKYLLDTAKFCESRMVTYVGLGDDLRMISTGLHRGFQANYIRLRRECSRVFDMDSVGVFFPKRSTYIHRYMYIAGLLNSGWSDEQIRVEMGHKSIESTRIYTRMINAQITF